MRTWVSEMGEGEIGSQEQNGGGEGEKKRKTGMMSLLTGIMICFLWTPIVVMMTPAAAY